ncbi:hypothetical protein Csa_014086 [Cucumis sativus]|uniref:Uncharacterized protein n=1 Tax=Cucumis sativus TaxID=3659 RepID=A0A0A0LRJ2_CUCSA|nr:hypothetical protein Csa_014086 [Cucumis sativus]
MSRWDKEFDDKAQHNMSNRNIDVMNEPLISVSKKSNENQNLKVEGSSSKGKATDDLIVKMEETVEKMKSVWCRKDNLVSSPLLACFVAAQTLLVVCTIQLFYTSTGDHQRSEVSVKDSSTTNEAADRSVEENKIKK